MSEPEPKGYEVVVEEHGKRKSTAWRPSYEPAVAYARTLSRAARKGQTVFVQDAGTGERRWTRHV